MKMSVDAFFKYAMFSHRWDAADDEPTYQHIGDAPNIYDMTAPPEIAKLQHFCKIARENQFRWAWNDTCCIDETNNVELQESIISMFSCIGYPRLLSSISQTSLTKRASNTAYGSLAGGRYKNSLRWNSSGFIRRIGRHILIPKTITNKTIASPSFYLTLHLSNPSPSFALCRV